VKHHGYRPRLVEYIRNEAKPPDKFSHQARLHALACRLARGRKHDDDVLFAAAWLHDLGVFIGHRPEDLKALAAWDNVAYAIKKAPGILKRFGFPAEKIPAVVEAIRTHQPGAKPTTYEGVVLRDADILEQLGAVSVLRTVSKVGRDTRFIRFSDALRVLKENCEHLPDRLALPQARQLAKKRVAVLKAFLKAGEAEANGVQW
jgi:uncharacterized protein